MDKEDLKYIEAGILGCSESELTEGTVLDEDYNFKSDYDNLVSIELHTLNKFLDKYGFEVEVVEDEDILCDIDWENSVGMFLNSIQDNMSVFPIALNKNYILNNVEDKTDLVYAIRGTIWHEAGHGIFNFLDDVYELDDLDEEEVVEDFAMYGEDSELYNILQQYINDDLEEQLRPKIKEDLSQEVDSEGNPLTKEQVEFFRNSKVRDSKGRLLVCYHGSDADRFDTFDHNFIGDDNKSGYGFYFTLGTKLKLKYTSEYACYINLTNPLTDMETIGKYVRDGEDLRSKGFTQKEIIDKLSKKYKCDGIINQERGVIAFNSNQIKSITNKTPSNSNNINEDWLSDANKTETIRQELNQAYDDLMGNDKTRLYRYREWANNSNNDYKEYIYNDLKKNKDKSLRLWYNTYRLRSGDYDLSYDDFLNTPITLYRATNVNEKDDAVNPFFSYAQSKKLAQRFLDTTQRLYNNRTGEIEELQIKPKDTLGMIPSDEYEIIVPNKAYQSRVNDMSSIVDNVINYANENNVKLPYDRDYILTLFNKRDKENVKKLEAHLMNYIDNRKGTKIKESVDSKTFTFPNLRQAIDFFWKDRNVKIETVPIKKLVDDNNLLNDWDLQSYHQRQWDNKKASEFSIDKNKAMMWRLSEVPYAVRKKDGRLELGDGRHRTRALYNDGYEYVTLPVITESISKTTPRIRESLLQEGKQDKENFKKWAEQAVEIAYKDRGLSDWERRGNAEYIVNWFEDNRKNLKSPQNDYYYWIKEKNVQGAYDELNRLAREQAKKKNFEKKSKEGARLIYSDNDWKVYEITTYEASVKYGANTKWCISGSKRWSSGENGKGYWDDYTSEGVKFYFFINKDTKYAIALYPNGTDFEIFDAQDNSIAYIPNAPIIDEIKVDYYSHNEDRLMLNLVKTGQLPNVCGILSSYLWKCNYYTDIYTKSDFDAFLHAIEENVNADYVKWLAVYDGLKDEEWYKQETGEEYEDEWMGDTTNYIYINFLDGYATLDDALTKDNPKFYYDESEYFINDLYECDIACCKDWVGVWLHIDKYIKDETDLINFIKRDIRDNWNYEDFEKVGLSKEYLQDVDDEEDDDLDEPFVPDVELEEESLEDFDDEVGVVYHGGIEKSLHKDFRSILWFTEDYDYALDFGENIFICNLNLKNTFIVGNTDGYIRGLIPTQFSTDFTRLANNLKVTPKELLKCNPEAKNIYSIVRTKAFKELCIKNGYDSVETEEFGHVCFGVFNLDQVDIVDTDFEDESTLETLSPMDEAFSYTDRTNVDNLTDLDRQYFDYIYSGQSKKAKEILDKLALDWGALSNGSTPLELYHGTPSRFTKFDAKQGFNVDAIYFSNSQSVAAHWSARDEYGRGVGIRDFAIDEINDLVDNANRDPNKLLDILNNHLYYQIGVNVVDHDNEYGDMYRLETPVTSSPLGYKKNEEIYFLPELPQYDVKYKEHNLVDELLDTIEYVSHKAFYYNNTLACYLKMKNPLIVDAKGSTYYEVEFEGKKTNTETISSIAKKRGYDGVIVNNVYETDLVNIKCDDYIVFEPNQIKSCNLIVTDDDAEIIPPSKRFTTSDDIREELKEDIAYRGHNKAYGNTLTGDIGFHFGTEKSAKEREQSYRRSKQGKSPKGVNWIINKYNINCNKLLELKDNGGFNWLLVIEQLSKLNEFKGDKGFAKILKYVKANFKDEYNVGLDISRLGNYDYYNYFVEKYPKSLEYSSKIHQLLRNFLKKKGYNGIQYVNNTEDKGSISYCIFDEKDVQLVKNETPTPNLRDIK